MAVNRVLAMDYGASSGRGIVGEFDGEQIKLSEVHRFANTPVFIGDTMHWDTLNLLSQMKQTINMCELEGGITSLAIDTWGVDFGLLDAYDGLVSNPVHYRDARTAGMIPECEKIMSAQRLYEITGLPLLEINTLTQLMAIKLKKPEVFERAKTMLLTPDLLGFFLTGEKVAEYSIASTTQMLDARTREWSQEILDAFGIPSSLLPKVTPSGTFLGDITPAVCEELSLKSTPKVISTCGHDTQDAMLAVPSKEKDFIFLSVGTWGLFGTELDGPIINDTAKGFGLSNEGGFDNKTSFLKNIIGTWLIQESRNQWKREGEDYSFGGLEEMAAVSSPFVSFVNPDAPDFVAAGNMPKRIREYCERTEQRVPQTPGAVVRCIDESLALTYRDTLLQVQKATGKTYDKIYLVGGGSQSALLCQMTADATGCTVYAGPVEATVLGNIAGQLIALGEVKDRAEARELISRSPDVNIYEPAHSPAWDEAFNRFKELRR